MTMRRTYLDLSSSFFCFLLIGIHLVTTAGTNAAARELGGLPQWANDNNIGIHPHVQWKCNGDNDWGLELTASLPRGTVLLRIPRSLVLDSAVIQSTVAKDHGSDVVEQVRQALKEFQVHQENFWIVWKLYQCRKEGARSPWAPWVAAMPQKFVEFTKPEQDCLPYFSKYICEYQEAKFQAFCQAAKVLGETMDSRDTVADWKWAFQAVNSRFWKTQSVLQPNQQQHDSRSELVPIGDLFNHRDPPNVRMVPLVKEEGEYVAFGYLGDDTDNDSFPKDLYITYGQPSNPHRFLVIFGFVPTDTMKTLWSHLILGDDNPYSRDPTDMVLDCDNGTIAPQVWDAIFCELQKSQKDEDDSAEWSTKPKWYAADFLNTHLTKQLDELASLRQKLDALSSSENLPLLRRHNEFLASVFGKAKENLKDILENEK